MKSEKEIRDEIIKLKKESMSKKLEGIMSPDDKVLNDLFKKSIIIDIMVKNLEWVIYNEE